MSIKGNKKERKKEKKIDATGVRRIADGRGEMPGSFLHFDGPGGREEEKTRSIARVADEKGSSGRSW